MPDYVITIKTDGAGGEAPKKVASTQTGERVDNPDKKSGFQNFMEMANNVRSFAATRYALKYADLAATTWMSRVELRTGSSTLQGKMEYEYNLAKNLLATGAAFVVGLATQNYVAAAAAVVSAVGIGVNYAISAENLRIAASVESIGIQQANIRAGANGGRNGNG